MTEDGTKTAYARIGLWFNAETGHIHLSLPGQGLSTVIDTATSKRGHPHLFNKLAKMLRDAGKPHPAIVEDWKAR
ncbi:hypothetical protein KPL78_11990 [Roseomonas sp. HJA6]|uniref:Uncharacterized protein n=1 Tax=Roseomonas alba TaxID=2846776 RepID=A0ABS7A8E3_9PROT|nr:hypothetical protein [Neoroseomonas alba]MBW6398575.1 hypothetical protein [Neoroseomonas alba]